MTKGNYNTTKRNFSHLSDTQRGKLEILAKEGTYTQGQMAKELGVDQPTISCELRSVKPTKWVLIGYFKKSGNCIYQANRKN